MPEDAPAPCPLCDRTMNRPKPLYLAVACRRCHAAFAARRYAAFLVDCLVFGAIGAGAAFAAAALAAVLSAPAVPFAVAGAWTLATLLWLAKDGFSGHSPGKAICGLRVVHRHTGEPIGIGQSIGRNVCLLIPLMPLVAAAMLTDGYRPGDSIANTKVVWKRHGRKAVFLGHAACESCQYDLTGTPTTSCPGCGTPISDSNRAMLGPAAPRVAERRKAA